MKKRKMCMCAGKSQRKMRKRTNQNPTADEKND